MIINDIVNLTVVKEALAAYIGTMRQEIERNPDPKTIAVYSQAGALHVEVVAEIERLKNEGNSGNTQGVRSL